MTVVPPEPVPGARSLFDIDFRLTYLNHGAFGAVPLPVRRTRRLLNDRMETDPVEYFRQRVDLTVAARHEVAEFLRLPAGRTAFVRNATTAAALALHAVDLREGDEVITTDHGYGAVGFNVDEVARRTGAVHRVVALPTTPDDDRVVAAITAAVTDRTRLVIVDQITSATARLFPIARLAAALADHPTALFVDGAHAPGHLELDVDIPGIDFWVGNLHKWLFAPRGTALLTVAEPWVGRTRPFVESWDRDSGFPVSVESNGTDDFTGWLAAPAGVAVMRDLGPERVRRHNAALVRYGQTVIAEALGVAVADPGPGPLAMRLVPLPDGHGTDQESARRIGTAIRDRLDTVVAVNSFHGRGMMRIAAQVYNTPEDYRHLADRLPGLLADLARA